MPSLMSLIFHARAALRFIAAIYAAAAMPLLFFSYMMPVDATIRHAADISCYARDICADALL